MTVSGLYIGYGITINCSELANILGTKLETMSDVNMSDMEPTYLEDIGECDHNHVAAIYQDLCNNKKIIMSQSNLALTVIAFPHTSEQYKNNCVALGIFTHVTEADNNSKISENFLQRILLYGIKETSFEIMFKAKPQFMVIADDCECC